MNELESLEEGLAAHEATMPEMNKIMDELEKRFDHVHAAFGANCLKSQKGGKRTLGIVPGNKCRPWSSRRAFVKWAGPCFLVGCCGYLGSAGLHIASYNYVHEMNAWNHTLTDRAFETHADRARARDVFEHFAHIPDPVEDNALGPRVQIQMLVLDRLALAFPALFTLLVIYTERCEVWTKVMLCTALLVLCKGIIGAITTVPDSSGWEVCRDQHLGPDGYKFLSQDLSFFQIVTVDFWWLPHYHHPLRYCSDMMFSGHTFFVTLYALGLYEVALIYTSTWHAKADCCECPKQRGWVAFKRSCVLSLVGLVAIGQQAGEIYFVLLSRFHYSSDVFVALILTFLFFTNGAVGIASKQWALRDVHLLTMGRGALRCSLDGEGGGKLMKWEEGSPPLLVPVETTRYCCLGAVAFADQKVENPPYGPKNVDDDCRRRAHNLDLYVSRGDVLVPWCCFPFCCLAGREHIYSDTGIDRLSNKKSERSHTHEGISYGDFRASMRSLSRRELG